jgi:uncharacterized membrane protein
VGRHLRTRLLVGFLVAFPLVVTLFFGRFIFALLDRWFQPIARHYFGFAIPGAGLLLFLLSLYLLGVLATNVFGSRLLDLVERLISRVPLVRPVYQGARKITEAIQLRGTTRFRRVVLVPFLGPGIRSLGFVTREAAPLGDASGSAHTLVFLPTTPNPTSGFVLAVPPEELVPLDLSVEDGIRLVISGGLLAPDGREIAHDDEDDDERDETERAGGEPRPVGP